MEQAKAGQVKLAKQTLAAIDSKQSPDFMGFLAFVEIEGGDFAAALKGIQPLTNRDAQARGFFTVAVRQTNAGQTNEARQTLKQAFAAAGGIDATVQDWRNLFMNKLHLLCAIARQQAIAGDDDGAQRTLRRALEFAEIKESDPRRPLNLLFDKMNALHTIAITQAEAGNWKAAQETWQKIRRWEESEPRLARPGDSLALPLARSRAKAGDARGALALAQNETEPWIKAQMLLGIAEGVLR
jgi:protein involved in polysaccharide export with SLBB domain